MAVTPHRPDIDRPDIDRPDINRPKRTPDAQDARQGRNVRGMVSVLVISLVLLLAAYGVFLALFGGGDEDGVPMTDIPNTANEVISAPPPPAAPPSQPQN